MKPFAIVAALLLALAIAAGAYALGRKSAATVTTSTLSVPTTQPPEVNWSGEYAYVSPALDEAVLVTLLQSPSGVAGTWTETATETSDAIALNGTETVVPPSNSFSMTLTRDGASSLSATIDNESTPTVEIYSVPSGIELQYLDNGGGSSTVTLSSLNASSRYQAAVASMDSICQAQPSACGQT